MDENSLGRKGRQFHCFSVCSDTVVNLESSSIIPGIVQSIGHRQAVGAFGWHVHAQTLLAGSCKGLCLDLN